MANTIAIIINGLQHIPKQHVPQSKSKIALVCLGSTIIIKLSVFSAPLKQIGQLLGFILYHSFIQEL